MELSTIKELITAFSEAQLTSLSLKCDDFEIKLGKEQKVYQTVATETTPVQVMPQIIQNTGVVSTDVKEETQANKVIKAPIVGTFYAASSPKAKPFVEVGSKVKKGDVVCVVEAMKLMNEVEAEVEGEIVEILASNEDMVEFGQPLFVLK